MDISSFFCHKTFLEKQLLNYGFLKKEDSFVYSVPILDNAFTLSLTVSPAGEVCYRVMENDIQEEYLPLHISNMSGSFVATVKKACENVFKDISEKCFVSNVFQNAQTKEIIEYVRQTYGDELEYLWPRFPDNAVWRRKDNRKWYGAVLTVSPEKLGVKSSQKTEIIDLRGNPDMIASLIDGQCYFPAWHMNKKSWYTIILNNSVPLKELCKHLDESYYLAQNK